MKSIAAQLIAYVRDTAPASSGKTGRNTVLLVRFFVVLVVMVTLFSVIFHYLMAYEERALGIPDREHSWITGFYWTLTVMSTLGFGDITFESDLGRFFSIIVLLSGTLFLLVLLPFTFIQFFYAPWMEAQAQARTPRRLPSSTSGHVVLTKYGPITADLMRRLEVYAQEYVLIVPDLEEALRLHDLGVHTMLGELDATDTYEHCRLPQAAVLVTTQDDVTDANVLFLARAVAPDVPLVSTADTPSAATIHRLAGATHVMQLGELMGESLARRTIGGDAVTHVVGKLGDLLIAEANASRTPLVGKTLRDNRLRDLGPSVLGIWDRGKFELATPDAVVGENAVLLLAGTRQQLDAYDEAFVIYNVSGEPVLLVGAGRVGRATAKALADRGIASHLVEQSAEAAEGIDVDTLIVGDAADPQVLREAGIETAPAALITTSSDTMNIYLTLQIRHLRPDIQIVARAERDQNVEVLHRAGADAVMSMASVGVSRILKFLDRAEVLPVAEGLNVTRVAAPASLVKKTIGELRVREETGVTLVAIATPDEMIVNPGPSHVIPPGADVLFIGTEDSERRFFRAHPQDPHLYPFPHQNSTKLNEQPSSASA